MLRERHLAHLPALHDTVALPGPALPNLPLTDHGVRCSLIERMPKWLICVPLAVQWLWLSLRYRSFTLPSAANPQIPSGGLVGEGKLDYFRAMGPHARAATAPWCAIENSAQPEPTQLERVLQEAGLSFPLIAKPDLGLCGYGVQKVADMAALLAYCAAFPRGETFVVQQYLDAPGEAGLFYARDPDSGQARLIGLALRTFPCVTGDGQRTLDQLIRADTRARRSIASAQHHSDIDSARVPAAGEVVRLATIGSTRVGGLYRNGASLITPALVAAVDAIARDMPQFYCGRFDVRFDDIAQLQRGRGFTIIEINGAGSEAIEAWDPAIGVLQAFGIIFAKQGCLFAIGDRMRARGAQPIGLLALRRLYQRQQRLIALYPPSN